MKMGLVQHGADKVLGHLTAQLGISKDGDIPHKRMGTDLREGERWWHLPNLEFQTGDKE